MAVSHYMMVPLQHNLCHSYCIISYYIANCLKFSMVLQKRSEQKTHFLNTNVYKFLMPEFLIIKRSLDTLSIIEDGYPL